MKGKLFKKALAVATSVLMLAGGASVQPFIDIFEDMAITASAADAFIYNLTFNTAGGTPVPEPQQVERGEKPVKPENPVKEGCTFEGWYIKQRVFIVEGKSFSLYMHFDELDFDKGLVLEYDEVTKDILACAKWSRPDVSTHYKDVDGTTKTVDAMPLDGQERILDGGWYVVDKDINYTDDLDIIGDANIILADGCKMSFDSGFGINAPACTLNFFSQSEGDNMGALNSDSVTADGVNIYNGKYNLSYIRADALNITDGTFRFENTETGISADKVNISGGDLYFRTSYRGIVSPSIYISGGNFDMECGTNGIYSDNKNKGTPLTITGGTFKNPGSSYVANGTNYTIENAGIRTTGDIKILGGQYDDLGKESGIYTRGRIYFGYQNPDDYIKISSWYGYVNSYDGAIADDAIILLKPFVLEGTDTPADVSRNNNNIKYKKIVPKTQTVTVTAKDTENNTVASSAAGSHTVVYGGKVDLTAPDVDGYVFRGWYEGETLLSADSEYTTGEITKDTTITALYETVSASAATDVFGTPINGIYTLESKEYVLTKDIYTVGRIYVPKGVNAIIDLKGHTIDRGLRSYKDGGGVIGVADGARLTVWDGTIKGGARGSGNNSGNGGGFNVNGDLVLQNVTIENCKAAEAGGGIYINGLNGNTASVIMTGNCTVRNNTAGTYGGGIYVGENADLKIDGKPVIKNNTKTNVYLTEGRQIKVSNALESGTEVGVTHLDEGTNNFTNGYKLYGNVADPSAYFFGDNGDKVVLKGDEARLAVEYVSRSWDSETKKVKENTLYVDTFTPFGKVTVTGNDDGDTVDLTNDQWYVLTKDTLLSHKVRVFIGANILLCDGKELTCQKGIVVENGNKLNIYGQKNDTGKITSTGDNYCAGIGGTDNSKNTVGTIKIFGGNITAKDGDYAAAIGGGKDTGDGTIEIYGGTVNAVGSGNRSVGIGGGFNRSAGNIRIYGGNVTAEGGALCPGIGCGKESETLGNIEIYGGRIVSGGKKDGAGIGGGYEANITSGSVIISGGYVEASGGLRGAGIGSGYNGDCNMDITITGGTVDAKCSDAVKDVGAAIGSGNVGDFTGKVTISGGTVTAAGNGADSWGSAGIGSGQGGNMKGTVNITGGTVTAIGACGAAAIGAGSEGYFFGGDCTGTISISGGTVRLKNETSENAPSVYIGRGYGGDEDGTLILGDNMKVQKRNDDDTDGEDVPPSDWITTCRTAHEDNRFLNIMSAETFEDGIGEQLYGHSLSLEGDIGVNFYMALADDIASSETAYMQFTTPAGSETETKTVLVKDAAKKVINGKTYYVFKCNVSAKDMASEITAQMFDGEKAGTKYTYSVKDYADYLLAHTEVEEYAKAAPLVKAMLNYGAASQTYFGIEGTPANAELDDADKALGKVSIPYSFKYTDNATLPEGVTFEGATLSLKSETTLSLYFKGLPEGTAFTCDGRTVETAKNGKYIVARIRGISSNELEGNFTVTFTGGSVTYNAMTYCYNVLNGGSGDENLQNVCKALYLYAEAAKSYFG